MPRPMLHLASSSPRRRELLATFGFDFTVEGVDLEERRLEGEAPPDMVLRLATAKACAAREGGQRLVLGADTAVVLDDRVFGKPADGGDAVAMLTALSGRRHQVLSGVALRAGAAVTTALSVTDVVFRDIRPDEARQYWQSGEPADKAGAYAIQGLGGVFVASIEGSYSGVVGLPIFETAELLRGAGLDVFGTTV
ncbi:MAG: Maf family protein [Woeseiaceae bacterium]|nr:Maf family protein [Woeseiaceae bacterium]